MGLNLSMPIFLGSVKKKKLPLPEVDHTGKMITVS